KNWKTSESLQNMDGLPEKFVETQGFDDYQQSSETFFYSYHALDAKLRTRERIQNLNTGTRITLPSFDRLTEFQSPESIDLIPQYNLSKEDARENFISEGMVKYIGLMAWEDRVTP